MKFTEKLKALEKKIIDTYESGVTLDEAEKLAAEFLHAQLVISGELTKADLDSRMKKSGNKAVRAKAYLDFKNSEQKITEAHVSALIESDTTVAAQQDLMDQAEVKVAELQRYYDIFTRAELFYKKIAEGRFNG